MNKTILNAGNVRRLDVVFPNGVQFNNIKQEETGMLFQILDRLGMTSEQMLSLTTEQLAKTLAGRNPQKIEPAKPKSKLLLDVIALYLAEKRLDNVPKTIDDKERTFNEFQGFFENKDSRTFWPPGGCMFMRLPLPLANSIMGTTKCTSVLPLSSCNTNRLLN